MNKEQKMVLDFHKKYGCLYREKPFVPDDSTLLLRTRLLQEEVAEFTKGASLRDLAMMADALCDIIYVAYGAAVCMGIDLEPIYAEVQRSNMTKDGGGVDGGGKIMKGKDFQEPDIIGEIKKQEV